MIFFIIHFIILYITFNIFSLKIKFDFIFIGLYFLPKLFYANLTNYVNFFLKFKIDVLLFFKQNFI